jgi:Domain of unknown function (DUF4145)
LMMRRLLEILLIHTFEHCGISEQALGDDGNYRRLKELIDRAKSKREIGLSADAKNSIDHFRELGNLSAHRIKYNCRRDDVRVHRLEFRALIEELLYKCGLRAINV